jgi:hypothetical protein
MQWKNDARKTSSIFKLLRRILEAIRIGNKSMTILSNGETTEL